MKDTKKKKRSPATKSNSKGAPGKGEEKSSQSGYNIEKRPSVTASSELQVPARTSLAANVVGDAFVGTYYRVLQESPELGHKFYKDDSQLGRPGSNGIMSITTRMKDINEKILSLSYGELSAEVISMDAQDSYGGGVVVLVTGFMIGKDNMRQKFTQCFFLAPQEKGYYVLNDVFRYVDEKGNQGSVQDVESPVTPAHGKEDEYHVSREDAKQHCDSMRSFNQKGKEQSKLAQKADAKASHDKFIARKHEVGSSSEDVLFSSEAHSRMHEVGSSSEDVLFSSEAHSPISPGSMNLDLHQKVLKSLFNIPKSTEHDKGTMNWRNVVKKMQSLGHEFDVCPRTSETQQLTYGKEDEYDVFREDAKQRWDLMRSFYEKAAVAYAKGDRAYAAYLSDQGKEQAKLAQKADAKASNDIFIARNKVFKNVITIDLHGQHVKPAMRMLKLHILVGSNVPSIQSLRVITGYGSHSVGKSKLKQSVINLLEKEAIEWTEENPGTVLIKLDGYKEFSFLDSHSDSDSN